MMYSCVHTHSTLCDGNNTMAEMAAAANKKGIKVYGFSGHLFEKSGNYGMTESVIKDYIFEAARLRQLYSGKMDILCGVEAEEAAEDGIDLKRFDYVIGSCHALRGDDGNYYPIDINPELLKSVIDERFSGDVMALIKKYYESFATYICRGSYDIIGHFDLVTKTNQRKPIFDEQSEEYKMVALSSLSEMLKTDSVFEVNTGAMSRGWRNKPYPDDFILKYILEHKGRVIITTDTHSKETIDYYANESEQILKAIGFKSVCELTPNGFIERNI